MVAPFEGFVIPPLLQSAILLVGTGIIIALLAAIRPPVTQKIAIAFVPWIASGAILHLFYVIGNTYDRQIFPTELEPIFSAPAVYLSVFIPMGAIWVMAAMIVPSGRRTKRIAQYIGATGIGVLLPLIGITVWQGVTEQADPNGVLTFEPIIPTLGLIITLVLTFVVYILIGAWRTFIIAEARYVGAMVIFAHLFDGITTAIGVDVLGAGERSVVPARIIEFAAGLPTAETIGSGWLFVLVKLVLASAIVIIFADYVSADETRGSLLFAFIAAVGLGPAVHNFFLFMLGVGLQGA